MNKKKKYKYSQHSAQISRLSLFVIFSALLLFPGCAGSQKDNACEERPDISAVQADWTFEPLHEEWKKQDSPESMKNFLSKHEVIAHGFFARNEFPSEREMADKAFELASNPHIDTLMMETGRIFGDLATLKNELDEAFRTMKYYFPDFQAPNVQTIVSGFNKDLYVSDTLVVVGLDYYLGEGAKFRPVNLPRYVTRRYAREYIVPSIVLLLGSKYIDSDLGDRTMLADMMYYGKAFHLAQKVLPCVPDSVLIGYTKEEIEGAEKHQDVIWASLLQNEMLYETSQKEKGRFMDERPKTLEIGPKCPGRVGRFMGWKIVNALIEGQDKPFQQVLKEKNAQKMLKKSRYKP